MTLKFEISVSAVLYSCSENDFSYAHVQLYLIVGTLVKTFLLIAATLS